jgi:transposase
MTWESLFPNLTIGLDLGDRVSSTCELDAAGTVRHRGTVPTTLAGITGSFGGRPRARVVLEVGAASPWVARLLTVLGHEVLVANPSAMYGSRRRRKRNDRLDAEFLARQGRADPALLHPIQHRGEAAQAHLTVLRSRDQLVGTRTKLINHVRGSLKSWGTRLRSCSAESFARQARPQLPDALRPALEPVLALLTELTGRIRTADREIARLIAAHYPEAQRLQQIRGVGPVTALAFVLLVEDPQRFRTSREVGAYFGLVPRLDESSRWSPQLRITKAGDPLGRRLLVNAAQYILGPFGGDCDLRRYGERLMVRGGKNAKKRAAVAVARKLAVLMHHLWRTAATYHPQHQGGSQAA